MFSRILKTQKEGLEMDVMATLVNNIHRVTFNDLTAEAIEAAKRATIDTLGVIIAGSSVGGCKLLIDYIRDRKGPPESTIAVFGDKAPCDLVALANSTMARSLEIADVFDGFPLHPSSSIIPACLAIAEYQGNINGKEFISSVALGHDLLVRMALANKTGPIQSGRYNLFKIFPPTGAAGKLMGLDEEELGNAMGIAFTQMVGDGQSALDGSMTHYLQQGMVAKSAVEACLMARKGITGAKNVLQGRYGFYNAYEPDPNLDAVTSDLGQEFKGAEISIKFYSSCRATHEAIDLALYMINEKGIDPKAIEKITVKVNGPVYRLVCDPLDGKRCPQSSVDAQFSLPYTVAAAMYRGDVFVHELDNETIKDPDILALASRVTPVVDRECETDLVIGATIMEVETRDGRRHSKKIQFPTGNPRNPVEMDHCVEKFKKCLRYSRTPFSKENVNKVIGLLCDLEKLENVAALCTLMVPGP